MNSILNNNIQTNVLINHLIMKNYTIKLQKELLYLHFKELMELFLCMVKQDQERHLL